MSANNGNATKPKTRRRSTAEKMAGDLRNVAVSEYFAKNRHMLGFGNEHRALLTTVKEAVDNSLDACEEAGIVPEIWVHLESTGDRRLKIGVQDNGPGIVKKKIPLIFGKLLYGSKFHRLRMSRGQQGIGISAAGMYGVQTTGKPVKIISKVSPRKMHYYEIRMDTKTNDPQILQDEDIPGGEKGLQYLTEHGIEWDSHYDADESSEAEVGKEVATGTRVTIEMKGVYKRGRGSVDEYLEQTAITNPHVTIHFIDPDGNTVNYRRSTQELPEEPLEILPHPYGVEVGQMLSLLKDSPDISVSKFLCESFSRVSPVVAKKICEGAGISTRMLTNKFGHDEAHAIIDSIRNTRIQAPATDCISPIGEPLLLKGLHQVVPGEFYVAATRPPSVYRGFPFQIEVALAYGGAATAQHVSLDMLEQLIEEGDARTLRKFLITTFNGLGPDSAEKIIKSSNLTNRKNPKKLKPKELTKLHEAMQQINIAEGQSMNVLRYANRVPLQFQPKACAITNSVMQLNWRSYGLSQSRGSLPSGPVTVVVHVASVFIPYTGSAKEAISGEPDIEKELRLGLQMVGRKLGQYLRKRLRVRQEAERRSVFLRYLGEVATAVSQIGNHDRDELFENLMHVAKRKTADADTQLDKNGKPIEEEELDLGDNVLIVDPTDAVATPEDNEAEEESQLDLPLDE